MCFVIGAVVSVDDFKNYVRNMHNDRDQLYEKEYSVSPEHHHCLGQIMKPIILNLTTDNQQGATKFLCSF